MRTRILLSFIFSVLVCLSAKSQDIVREPVVFNLYNSDGSATDFASAINRMATVDIVLFGELHDHPVLHWLQLRTAEALAEKTPIIMGGEMWETDNQILLDEYIAGRVNDKRFEADARLWPNYKTDYKPLLKLAKDRKIPFIATNVPRRYAGFVSQYGLDTLTSFNAESKAYFAPLPIAFSMDIPGYGEMMEMMHGGGMGPGMNAENFVKAQALKDATMANRILKYRNKGHVFLHFNGDYHSANYGGIYWYLKNADKKLNIYTIKVYSENEISFNPEWKNSGDLIIVVPEDFTRTH
jgi:uncharacterized iron-regulated protein